MTTSIAPLVALLRAGPTDSEGYRAPAFTDVVARGSKRHAKAAHNLRSFAELAAAAAVVAVLGSVLLLDRQGSGGASNSDVTAAAAAMGVPAAALVDAGGAFVAPRWDNGKLALVMARSTANGWTIVVIARTGAPRPAGASASAMDTATCDGINLSRPVFVYGQVIGWNAGTLALHGLKPTGGRLVDGSFVFAAAAVQTGTRFWITGSEFLSAPEFRPSSGGVVPSPHHDDAVFEGQTAAPVPCAGA